jgi:hypothetical protein
LVGSRGNTQLTQTVGQFLAERVKKAKEAPVKNRLSLTTTIIIFLDTILVGISTMWLLEEKLGLPEWISLIITLVILLISYELVSRMLPEKSDAPITHFLKLSKRDKVIFLVGILAMCIVVIIGKSFNSDSGWVNLLFLVLGLLAWRLTYQFFGSDEIMKM